MADYVEAMARVPFVWGQSDSLMFVAGAVERLTGVDHAAEFRGRYGSCAAGRRLVGMSLLAFVGARCASIAPSQAGDGDIAVMRQGRDWAFGIFIGAQVYAQTRGGLGIRPRRDAVKAFRVA